MLDPRHAAPADLAIVGRLLRDFNAEFGDPAPGPAWLAERIGELIATGDTTVMVSGEEPVSVAIVRYRKGLWSAGLEGYLAELYVVPELRGRGVGTALMAAVMDDARERGADQVHIAVDESDIDARRFYERLGFTNRRPDGGLVFHYEREL